MTPYKPTKLRSCWRLTAMALRGLVNLLTVWPLLLAAGFVISPVGPHIRLQYSYEQHGPYRHMIACQYLGSRGLIWHRPGGDPECPFITILDRRVVQ